MKNDPKNQWRFVADVRIQGLVCIRLAIYWVFCQIFMAGTILAIASLADGPTENSSLLEAHFIIPALAVSALIFPIFVFDMLVFTNRFVGPMVNFRRKMKQLAENETCDKIRFRDGDYYVDLAEHFNQIQERLQAQSQSSTSNPSTNFLPPLETSQPTGMENHV